MGEVRDAGHDVGFLEDDRAPGRVGEQGLEARDGGADGDAGALADVWAAAGEAGDLGNDFLHVVGDVDAEAGDIHGGGLLPHDRDFGLDGLGVVSADLRAVAVFEGRDDATAVGVVLRVGAGDDEDVEGKADAEAANLNVALFHDVEQPHLDALSQVRQFVDTEDAAIGARDEAVVDGEFVGEVAALGDLDGVHFADQVGDRDVRGGELLAVAVVAGEPANRRLLALFGDQPPPLLRDGGEGVLGDFGAVEHGGGIVEEGGEGADNAALGLATLAQQDDVLAGQDCILEGGNDGLIEALDAGEEGATLSYACNEVLAHLLADRAGGVATGAKLGQRLGAIGVIRALRRLAGGGVLSRHGWGPFGRA